MYMYPSPESSACHGVVCVSVALKCNSLCIDLNAQADGQYKELIHILNTNLVG